MTTALDVVVVDASLALKWVLDEPGSGASLILLVEWQQDGIQPIAPSWIACELWTADDKFRDAARGILPRVRSISELQQS